MVFYDCSAANDNYKENNKNDKKEGKGIEYNKTGKYEGEFKKGKREGKGIFYFFNGDKYEGDFKNGFR